MLEYIFSPSTPGSTPSDGQSSLPTAPPSSSPTSTSDTLTTLTTPSTSVVETTSAYALPAPTNRCSIFTKARATASSSPRSSRAQRSARPGAWSAASGRFCCSVDHSAKAIGPESIYAHVRSTDWKEYISPERSGGATSNSNVIAGPGIYRLARSFFAKLQILVLAQCWLADLAPTPFGHIILGLSLMEASIVASDTPENDE